MVQFAAGGGSMRFHLSARDLGGVGETTGPSLCRIVAAWTVAG